jgi:hypothetical protein
MRAMTLAVVATLLLVTGCGQTTTSRSLSGAGVGAAAGGVVGSMGGNFGSGALIGAGAGAVGGYLYDQHKKGNID